MKLNSCVKLLEGTGWGPSSLAKFITTITIVYDTYIFRWGLNSMVYGRYNKLVIWWLIPLSKWDITPVINGISRVNPLIIGVITHLLSEMSHQVMDVFMGVSLTNIHIMAAPEAWSSFERFKAVCTCRGVKPSIFSRCC